jgi:hypothetical protein
MSADDAPSAVKSFARATGLAKLYRLLVRSPLNRVRKSIREGGPIEQWKTRNGKEAMRQAATELRPLDRSPEDPQGPLKVHFLTGKDHWYQTLFCFVSLQRFVDSRVTPVLYSDGSLSEPYREQVRRVVPWVEIRTQKDIEERLDDALPRDQYPLLREWREIQPLTRKITDLHAGGKGWKLLLDSDMLFFRRPDFLIEYLRQPERPCFMVDVRTTYGYSPQLRYRLVENTIPEAANIGIFGLKSDEIDFDRLQYWLRVLVDEEDRSYNITQALSSLLFAQHECTAFPPAEYVVHPSLSEGKSPTATLHHYVASSKQAYFQYAWRHVLRSFRAGSYPDH